MSGFDLDAFVRILVAGAVLLVLAGGTLGVWLVGVYSRDGERLPCRAPRCVPCRGELLSGERPELEQAHFAAWEREVAADA